MCAFVIDPSPSPVPGLAASRPAVSPVPAMPSPTSPVRWHRVAAPDATTAGTVWRAIGERTVDQLAPGSFLVTTELGLVGSSALVRDASVTAVEMRVRLHTPSFVCAVPIAGAIRSRYFGQPVGALDALTLEPGMDLWIVASPGAEFAMCVVPESVLLRHAEALQLARPRDLRGLTRRVPLQSHRLQGLRRFLVGQLGRLAMAAASVPLTANAEAGLEESLACLAVCTFLGRAGGRGAGRPVSSYDRIVRRAREFVVSRPRTPPTLVELCEHVHVGVRALNYALQHAIGVSAGDYLRAIRLNRVREDLLRARDRGRVSVAEIAAAWGFWHASQFARQYRDLFGELPSVTARAPRAGVSAGRRRPAKP